MVGGVDVQGTVEAARRAAYQELEEREFARRAREADPARRHQREQWRPLHSTPVPPPLTTPTPTTSSSPPSAPPPMPKTVAEANAAAGGSGSGGSGGTPK